MIRIGQLACAFSAVANAETRLQGVRGAHRRVGRVHVQARVDEVRWLEGAVAHHDVGNHHFLVWVPPIGKAPIETANVECGAEKKDGGEENDRAAWWPWRCAPRADGNLE